MEWFIHLVDGTISSFSPILLYFSLLFSSLYVTTIGSKLITLIMQRCVPQTSEVNN